MENGPELARVPDHRSSLFTGYRVEYDLARAAGRCDARLDEIYATYGFAPGQPDPSYSVLNEIELRLLGVQDFAALAGSSTGYIARARMIGLEAVAEALGPRVADAIQAKDAGLLRALMADLLRRTHERFHERRQEREAREGAASRLIWTGGALALLWALALLAGFGYIHVLVDGEYGLGLHEVLGRFHLAFLASFGILGAYLSRLIAFQSQVARLTWDDVDRLYARRVIAVRLAFGAIAAITTYYLIMGRVIGGDLFPNLHQHSATAFGPTALSPAGNVTLTRADPAHYLWVSHFVMEGSATAYVLPSLDFAKLIFWCLLSGFAERFLPEQLARAETVGAK